MALSRLIYRSTADLSALDEKSLNNLDLQAATNNLRMGICGLLVLSGDRFLQVLEGDSKAVNKVYGKVIKDNRHYDVNLISYEGIVNAEFMGWDMHLVNLESLDTYAQKTFRENYPINKDTLIFNDDANLMFGLLIKMRDTIDLMKWPPLSRIQV